MEQVSIVDCGSYLPEKRVGVDFFFEEGDPLEHDALLRAPEFRHHVERTERASAMIEKAARPMFERLGIEPEGNVDLLLTNVLLPDMPITGSGAEAARALGCNPASIIDLHNGGCASFAYMLQIAQTMIGSGAARSALLCNVQNGAGRLCTLPKARRQPGAAVLGDGAGVAYVTAGGDSPLLGVEIRNNPESASDMGLESPDGRLYWEPGESELAIRFNTENLSRILELGNQIVPEVVSDVCAKVGVEPSEIDALITNQPNRIYMRNWREALGIPEERHLNTFDRFGNLLCAGVPVTLDHALRDGLLSDGDLVVVAGFAHAGDFAAAAALRWGGEGRAQAADTAERAPVVA